MHGNDDAVYSRRKIFGLAGAGIGVSILGACQISTESDPTAQTKGKGGKDGAKTVSDLAQKIRESGGKIPDREIEFQWMDSGDLKALFEKPFFEAYQEIHPNVKIDYQDSSWERINEVIPLSVRNNSAPDVFAKPQNVPTGVMIRENWVRPIDDLIPDFEKWKTGFPKGMFLEGIHIFNGKTYAWPLTGSKRLSHMLMFDPEYLEKAGYDPIGERFTWSTFREACKKITKQGKGKYYGLMTNGDQLGGLALSLARLAGMRGEGEPPMDFKTGEYVTTAPELEEAFELLLALKSDGSLFPGFMSMADADSRARMPQRVAGMIFDGPWDIPEWQATNPNYEFDIALPPYGDDKEFYTYPYQENGTNFAYVSKDTENGEVVGDMFRFMGSLEGQVQMVLLSQGNLTSVVPEANEKAKAQSDELDPLALKAINVADELMRICPQVQSRNADASKVLLELEPVTPNMREIGQGILSGDITNIGQALKKYNDESERSLDKAIAAANKKGANISRDDWKFPNWDRMKEYTQADYEALSK